MGKLCYLSLSDSNAINPAQQQQQLHQQQQLPRHRSNQRPQRQRSSSVAISPRTVGSQKNAFGTFSAIAAKFPGF